MLVTNEHDLVSAVEELSSKFKIVGVLNLTDLKIPDWIVIHNSLKKFHKDCYENNEKILVVMDHDWYSADATCGIVLEAVQRMINILDISNFFIELVTTNSNIKSELDYLQSTVSQDLVPINVTLCKQGQWKSNDGTGLTKFDLSRTVDTLLNSIDSIDPGHYDLLFKNPVFCMAPWSHLLVNTDQTVYPCCKSKFPLGDLKVNSLQEIWNDAPVKELRASMLDGQRHRACQSCYAEEDSNKSSYRNYVNQKLMNRVGKVDSTSKDGYHSKFEINYLHFKFNNLCNLACRSCGPDASSSWHAVSLALGDISKDTPALSDANHDGQLFQEFEKHLDHIDLIKFTGGEPLIIQEFYDILDLLIAKNQTNVDLFYNTNLMQLKYRGRSILDIWKQFPKIVVGGSIDAEGTRGEYLRSFSKWSTILKNIKLIKEECPHVYFFLSPTISILNCLHLPDMHKSLVDQGLINPQDFDINLLTTPAYLSVINAPPVLKDQIKVKYAQHLEWLRQVDKTGRSHSPFESIIKLLDTPGKFDKDLFWYQINRLDEYHQTNLLDTFPELKILT